MRCGLQERVRRPVSRRKVPAPLPGVPIHQATASPGQARRPATTGVPLPPGLILSPGVHPAVAALTILRARRAAAAALTAGQAVQAAAAAPTAGQAVPAAVALTAGQAVPAAAGPTAARPAEAAPTVQGVAAAAPTAQGVAAAAEAQEHAVPVDPAVPPGLLHPVQDVKLSFSAGIHSMVPAFSRLKFILL